MTQTKKTFLKTKVRPRQIKFLINFQNTHTRTRLHACSRKDTPSTLSKKTYAINCLAFLKKLYRFNMPFNLLTSEEQELWNSFDISDITFFLSGERVHGPDYSHYLRGCKTSKHPIPKLVGPLPPFQPGNQPNLPPLIGTPAITPPLTPGPAVRPQTRSSIRSPDHRTIIAPLSISQLGQLATLPRLSQANIRKTTLFVPTMIRFTLWYLSIGLVLPASLFDNMPPIISDPAHSTPIQNNQHQFLFQPKGKYEMDVHYSHIWLPIYFKPILQSITNVSNYLIDVLSESKPHATNLVIQEIIDFNHICVDLIKQNFENLIANLPSKPVSNSHVEKRQILELFGIAGLLLALLILLQFLTLPHNFQKKFTEPTCLST